MKTFNEQIAEIDRKRHHRLTEAERVAAYVDVTYDHPSPPAYHRVKGVPLSTKILKLAFFYWLGKRAIRNGTREAFRR